MKKLVCSVGIMVFNEEKNIKKLLDAFCSQKLQKAAIGEIIVVSSGSTDNTNSIVLEYSKIDSRVKLVVQKTREGKSSAVNLFLKLAKHPILVLSSGDVLPKKSVVERFVTALSDTTCGMVAGRVVPVARGEGFVQFCGETLWELHHHLALISPKMGEMVAFKALFEEIPSSSSVDEASIEALIKEAGLKLKYLPDAVIYNKTPESLSDFVLQRRRIAAGHIWLSKNQKYLVSSQKTGILIKILLKKMRHNLINLHKILAVVCLEVFCRLLGSYDYYIKKENHTIWKIAKTTKQL